MAKLLMLIGDNFEDVEGIATLDVLVRGKNDVTVASCMKRNEIRSKVGLNIRLDTLIEDINPAQYDGLIIPGGPGSFTILDKLAIVTELIRYFADNNKLVASICAAPFLVGRLGYFKDMDFTVHPGFEDAVIGGNYLRDQGVVRRDNFITAKSMYYSIQFGLEIHEYFYGKDARNTLEKSLQGEK